MKKWIHWKLVLSISIFLSILLITNVIYRDYMSLPSENWSKYITLYQSASTEDTNNYYNDILDATSTDDNLLITFSDKNTLNLQKLDENGNILSSNTFEMTSPAFKLSISKNAGTIDVLVAHEYSILKYSFNESTLDFISEYEVTSSYDDVKFSDGTALYFIEDTFYFFNGTSTAIAGSNKLTEQFDYSIKDDSVYISILEYDYGYYYYAVQTYDLMQSKTSYTRIEKISTISGTISLDIDSIIHNQKLYGCIILKNTKFGQNYIDTRVLDLSNFSLLESYDATNMNYDPNMHIVVYNDQVCMAYNDKSFIGKHEIGSQFSNYTNVFLKSIDDVTPIDHTATKILTKSQNYAPNMKLILFKGHHYLFTSEILNQANYIYLSSDIPSIIEKSLNMTFDEYKNILFGALTYIPTSLLTIWSVIIGLIIPVAFIAIPIAIFKMNWVEHNHGKMLKATLAAYLLIKIYYFYDNWNSIYLPFGDLGATPFHLSTVPAVFATFIFTTGISFICLYLQRKRNPETHFITSFFSFFGFEMIQYMLYITVYLTMFK